MQAIDRGLPGEEGGFFFGVLLACLAGKGAALRQSIAGTVEITGGQLGEGLIADCPIIGTIGTKLFDLVFERQKLIDLGVEPGFDLFNWDMYFAETVENPL